MAKLGGGFGEIVEVLRRATVQIGAGRGGGAGVILAADGALVTNAHVAQGARFEVRYWDGESARADLVARDPSRDLALLRSARRGMAGIPYADSDGLRRGDAVVAVGHPLGFVGAMSAGVVQAVAPVPGLGPRSWIQADIRLAPGNSGGPLADVRGQLAGLNTMVAGGLGLAVPSNVIRRFVERGAQPAPLGVVVQPVRLPAPERGRFGLLISAVAANSAAEAASLMLGDILVGVADKPFSALEDLERALGGSGERPVRLQFLRGGHPRVRTTTARLGAPRPAAA